VPRSAIDIGVEITDVGSGERADARDHFVPKE
jgi:hypothetical protein